MERTRRWGDGARLIRNVIRAGASESPKSKIGAGFSAGLRLFRCMLVQLGAESENAKAKHVSALRVREFWCDCLGRILSPV